MVDSKVAWTDVMTVVSMDALSAVALVASLAVVWSRVWYKKINVKGFCQGTCVYEGGIVPVM